MINKIIEEINKKGHSFFVGGFIRDKLLKSPSKDIDIEVFGVNSKDLVEILANFGKVNQVGSSFGVIKLITPDGQDFDFSLPRRENKQGQGHKGFIVECDPSMTIEEAASRRDFTFNSLAQDIQTGEIIDHFGGLNDLKFRTIRHTGPAFSEDPLRVLRGMQFAGRFDFKMAQETIELCQNLVDEFETLAPERIWGEFFKWASKSIRPSRGLKVLNQTGWLAKFPQLANLVGCPQDDEFHPEGDVWQHTLHVVDAAAKICDRDGIKGEDKAVIVMAALCHDLGKPATTGKKNGRWASHGHDKAGEQPTRDFLEAMKAPKEIVEKVIELVCEHMIHIHGLPSKRIVRRLITRLKHASIDDLIKVIEADHSGRPPLAKGLPENANKIREIANEIGDEVKPILMGRHLIEMGVEPGPKMGQMLKQAFEAQLDGAFSDIDGAKVWVSSPSLKALGFKGQNS